MARRKIGTEADGRLPAEDRITSYNVCYTKLLRIAFQAGTSGWATLVSDAHAAGIKAYVWTITSQAQADRNNFV